MIKVDRLTKRFGRIVAVNGVEFEVQRGEVLGFLGPNGAGKSTTMKMLTCFLEPDEGAAQVDGHDILKNPVEVRRRIGYVPENAPIYGDMTVASFLKFVGDVRGMGRAELSSGIERVVEMCTLSGVFHQTVETLSKGYKRRVGLAQALLHDPDVLILDEPTDGLDPNQKHEVRQLIRRLGETKVVLFSTHILEEVEAACTRAVIVDRGKIVVDGTPDELKAKSGTGSLTDLFRQVTTRDTEPSEEEAA
jgi:ABC-2 type transport system ATP-binding protein